MLLGLPGALSVINPPEGAGDPGSIPGSGGNPGEGTGNPLQYSCLEDSTDRGARWAIIHGVAESWTQLIKEHFHFRCLPQSWDP